MATSKVYSASEQPMFGPGGKIPQGLASSSTTHMKSGLRTAFTLHHVSAGTRFFFSPMGVGLSAIGMAGGASMPRMAYDEMINIPFALSAGRVGMGVGRAVTEAGIGVAKGVFGPGYNAAGKLASVSNKKMQQYQAMQTANKWGRAAKSTKLGKDIAGGAGAIRTAMMGASAGSVVPVIGSLVGGAAALAGTYLLGDAFYDYAVSAPRKMMEYGRNLRTLETGKGFQDPFGTAHTMRQRSLKEMQRSHLNARSALGGEAYFNHIR